MKNSKTETEVLRVERKKLKKTIKNLKMQNTRI
jgi:hypothetical protein